MTAIINANLIRYIYTKYKWNIIMLCNIKLNYCLRYLRNVSVEHVEPAKPKVEFTADGVLKSAELKIMNLRPGIGNSLVWEEVS